MIRRHFSIAVLTLSFLVTVEGKGLRRKGGLFGFRDSDSSDDDVNVIRVGGGGPIPPFGVPLAGGGYPGVVLGGGYSGGFNLPPPTIQVINPAQQGQMLGMQQVQAVEQEELLDLSVAEPPPPVQPPPPTPSQSTATTTKAPTGKGRKRRVTVTDEPSLVCPSGFELTPDGPSCVQEDVQYSARTCPAGYQLDRQAARCSSMLILTPTFLCDEGYESDVSECVKRFFAPQQMTCKEGFEIEETHCVRYVQTDPDLFCESGFVLDADPNFCVMTVTAKPEMFCKLGYEPHDGMCIKEVSRPQNRRGECDLPYMPTTDGDCLKVEVFNAKLKCPHGTALVPPHDHMEPEKMCEGVMTEPSAMQCPPDYEEIFVEGKMLCRGKITTSVEIICPQGFENVEGQCTKALRRNKRAICEEGFEYNNGQCVKPQYMAARLGCPPGYKVLSTDDTYCTKQLRSRPRYGCKDTDMEYDPVLNLCHKEDFIFEGSSASQKSRNAIDYSLMLDTPFR